MKLTPLLLVAVVAFAVRMTAQEYPLRAKYADEKYISTPELVGAFADSVVIDTRDQAEFDVLHIAGAKLLPVEKLKEADITAVRAKQDAKKLVFYCNGVLCEKSYRAAQMARLWGFQNTYVYDAGIFDWAKIAPERALFFGKPLSAQSGSAALISKEKFDTVCLAPDAFKARAADASYKVFDIRDRSDRAAKQVKFKDDVGASMVEFVGFLDKGVVVPKQKILIYDNVGRQVVWLQYYLEKYGIKDYYFLRGGVNALGK